MSRTKDNEKHVLTPYPVSRMTELKAQARWVCCPMCDKDKCEFGASDCDAKKWMDERGEQDE